MRRSGFYTGDGGVFSADKTGDRFMSHMKNQMMGRLSDRRQKFIGKTPHDAAAGHSGLVGEFRRTALSGPRRAFGLYSANRWYIRIPFKREEKPRRVGKTALRFAPRGIPCF